VQHVRDNNTQHTPFFGRRGTGEHRAGQHNRAWSMQDAHYPRCCSSSSYGESNNMAPAWSDQDIWYQVVLAPGVEPDSGLVGTQVPTYTSTYLVCTCFSST
jgi:hypothetical protein